MAQYRRGIFNLAPGPGLAVDDPRVGEDLARRQLAVSASQGSASLASQMAQAIMAQNMDRERMGLQASQFGQEMAARIALSNADRALQRESLEKQLGARAQEGAQQAAMQRQALEAELADRAAGRSMQADQFGKQQSLQAQMANQQAYGEGLNRAQRESQFGQTFGLQKDQFGEQKAQNLFNQGMAKDTLGEQKSMNAFNRDMAGKTFQAGRADAATRDTQWKQSFGLQEDQFALQRLMQAMQVAQARKAEEQAAREMAWQTLGQDNVESLMGGDRPDNLQALLRGLAVRNPEAAAQMGPLLDAMATAGAQTRQESPRLFSDYIPSLGTPAPDANFNRGRGMMGAAQDRAMLSGAEFYDAIMRDRQALPAGQPSPYDLIVQQLLNRR